MRCGRSYFDVLNIRRDPVIMPEYAGRVGLRQLCQINSDALAVVVINSAVLVFGLEYMWTVAMYGLATSACDSFHREIDSVPAA